MVGVMMLLIHRPATPKLPRRCDCSDYGVGVEDMDDDARLAEGARERAELGHGVRGQMKKKALKVSSEHRRIA
jgi:hypothetical protein